jgi:hypothetical protein
MSNKRDTQFIGFAKLLLQEMHDTWGCTCGETDDATYMPIIARRVYDLMLNAIDAWGFPPAMLTIRDVPDLKEWPEVEK